MDGHFVENISFGPKLIADLRRHTDLFLDVHLMLDHPESFAMRFAQAGANAITIHQEATCDVAKQLGIIKNYGCQCGLAINPETAANPELLKFADIVLIMGVSPGFGGQNFMAEVNSKVLNLRNIRDGKGLFHKISVDGGVTADIARKLVKSGADVIVSGSAFFADPQAFNFLRN
jgi:ribulose-phosphate 3-epimerase